MAEKATVELLKFLVDLTVIKETDEHGNRIFSLPDEQINEQNWREELKLPIDKFDWICFEKIYQNVFIYPETERNRLCRCFVTYFT